MTASPVFSFGVHILSPTSYASYKDGIVVDHCSDHPDRTANTLMAILALDSSGFRVSRFEARTAPGGTLLFADDFSGAAGTIPTGWSVHNGLSPSCRQDGSGHLYIQGGGFSEGISRTQPIGAAYLELQGCFFDDQVQSFWGMVVAHWSGMNFGDNSYRVLAMEVGQTVEIRDCTSGSLGGWRVGAVAIA